MALPARSGQPRREDLRGAEAPRGIAAQLPGVCPVGAVGRDDLPDLRRQQFQALAQRPARLPGDAPDFAGERSRAPGRTLRHARRDGDGGGQGGVRERQQDLPLSFGHRPRVVVQLCHDQQTPGREHRNVLAERTADARSADVRIREEMDQDPEPVFDAHIRQRRAAAHPLFQASARDRRPAGLTPRSRCGVSPAGTKRKGRVSQPSPRSLRMCGT